MVYKIMLVEDDSSLSSEISSALSSWGYSVEVATDFANITSCFLVQSPHLILLDINLPQYDGFYWCQKLRELSNVPIIFISSRDSNMDILMALNNGGDDYVTKPFAVPLLIGKIQAALRRSYQYSSGEKNDVVELAGLILMPNESAAFVADSKIELTKNELKILSLLMQRKGKIVSRNDLMNVLWDDDEFVNDNTLTVNVNRLRSKLSEAGLPNYIETKKGQGYVISSAG